MNAKSTLGRLSGTATVIRKSGQPEQISSQKEVTADQVEKLVKHKENSRRK